MWLAMGITAAPEAVFHLAIILIAFIIRMEQMAFSCHQRLTARTVHSTQQYRFVSHSWLKLLCRLPRKKWNVCYFWTALNFLFDERYKYNSTRVLNIHFREFLLFCINIYVITIIIYLTKDFYIGCEFKCPIRHYFPKCWAVAITLTIQKPGPPCYRMLIAMFVRLIAVFIVYRIYREAMRVQTIWSL